MFNSHLQNIGFEISKADHLLYVQRTSAGIVVIVVYVDDVIITGDCEKDIDHIKGLLKAKFDMKDLGELMYFLGIEVIRTADGIWLLQRKYVLDMLEKFGMTGCKPIDTPIEQNAKLRSDVGEVLEDATLYRKVVGSLIYATLTRPNMCHEVRSIKLVYASTSKATFGCCEKSALIFKGYVVDLFMHMDLMLRCVDTEI